MRNAWPLPMHAIAMLTALGLAVLGQSTWPLAVMGALSFAGLVASAPGSAARKLGPANRVTLARLLLVLVPLALLSRLPVAAVAGLWAAAFVLDALDGVVARRYGCVSELGALLDAETDAALVLAAGLALWLGGMVAWILVPGTLRYVYVIAQALSPAQAPRSWRSRFGRRVFLGSTSLLLAALVLPGALATASAAVAAVLLGASFARSFRVLYTGAETSGTGRRSLRRSVGATLLFLLCWSFLDLVVNLRYPANEPVGWYFLPSLDVTIVLGAIALLGLVGLRVPAWLRIPLVVLLVVARGIRIGDGVTGHYFGKPFNFYTDLPLAPELVRYAHSTFAAWKFYLGATVALAAVALFVFAVDRCVAYAATYLRRPRQALVFAALVVPFAVTSAFLDQDPRYNERYAGAFGSSIAPRFRHQATFLLNVYDHRQSGMRAIGGVQETLSHTPTALDRLHHANVYVVFVESYGMTVLDRPSFVTQAVPALRAMQADLDRHGFHMASGKMDSATYGGMSWLAHATFLTGVRTGDQLQYDLLGVARPRSLARIAHEAGYHTVLVQPNTNRVSHTADFYDFDRTYKNWDFDYAGPAFAWASMPDQYVLDFIRRDLVSKEQRPLFVMYNLVSSHAPWSHVPTLVADWSRIGNGALYNDQPFHHAPVNWPGFENAAEPYLRSILYDLEVLGSYLDNFVDDDSLFIVLGDHQPVSEVTDNSPSWAVPVHVISRNPALVEPFVARGYAPGMLPGLVTTPMESFLLDFLRDYSGGAT